MPWRAATRPANRRQPAAISAGIASALRMSAAAKIAASVNPNRCAILRSSMALSPTDCVMLTTYSTCVTADVISVTNRRFFEAGGPQGGREQAELALAKNSTSPMKSSRYPAGRQRSQGRTRLGPALVRSAAAHDDDGFSLRLFGQNRAFMGFYVLHHVIVSRQGRGRHRNDNEAGAHKPCYHSHPRFPAFFLAACWP
jgi:hypothetical protein